MDAHSMSYGERVNDDDCNEHSPGNAKGGGPAMEQCFVKGLPLVTTATSTCSLTVKGHLNTEDPASSPQPGKRLIERENRCNGVNTKDQGSIEIGECSVIGYSKQTGSKPASPSPIRMSNGKLQCDVCGMICIGPNVLMVHKRSHTGERPFKCNQCGASFTQKGNLLRHTKLHSGEKPFKCPFCKYACRRRDALTGHIRTHSDSCPTIGKPFKCSSCGRTYKQKSSLDQHDEHCNLKNHCQSQLTLQTELGKESLVLEPINAPVLQPSSEKLALVDRLANSIAKRKRSTPQKFLGEKHMQAHVLEAHFELSPGSDLEQDLLSSPLTGDLAGSAGMSGFPQLGSKGGAENPEPSEMAMTQPTCMSELPLVLSSVFRYVAPQGVTDKCAGESELPAAWEMGEGQEAMPLAQIHTVHTSPSNGGLDTESTAGEQSIGAAVSTSNSNHNHVLLYSTPILPRCRKTTSHAKDSEPEWDRNCAPRLPYAMLRRRSGSPPSSKEAVQVVDAKGRVVHSFRCEHCHILFVDHVMFTIHMGCHGFRQPFECNICGYCSVDRYEFASHISRGEHDIERRGGLCVEWCHNGRY